MDGVRDKEQSSSACPCVVWGRSDSVFGLQGVAIINFSFSLCVLSRAAQIFILSIFHKDDDVRQH